MQSTPDSGRIITASMIVVRAQFNSLCILVLLGALIMISVSTFPSRLDYPATTEVVVGTKCLPSYRRVKSRWQPTAS